MRLVNSALPAMIIAMLVLVAGCDNASRPRSEQGFAAALSQTQQSGDTPFLQPGPGTGIHLPQDLGPHPQHRIEWWYLTANLTTADGEPLGLQWTQFRQSLQARKPQTPPPGEKRWPLQSAWMAHAAIAYQGEHWFAEKLARGDVGQAGAEADPLQVWLDDWQLDTIKTGKSWRLRAAQNDWRYDLQLTPTRAPVRHGVDGFSAKSEGGEGSMYFSYVNLAISGTVTVSNQRHEVSGTGWFDREWSSQFLKTGQQGWDWFALHLDSGAKLMAFRLRGEQGAFHSGTWVTPSGETLALEPGALSVTPAATGEDEQLPRQWRIEVPGQQVALTIKARPGDHWNNGVFPYWEGPVTVDGSHGGVGYMELTGYSIPGASSENQ